MSGAIGPGDWVECIDVLPLPWQGAEFASALEQLTLGGVYLVRGITERRSDGKRHLLLAGVRALNEHHGAGWLPHRFRPISGGERGMFDHMLKLDAPSKEPVAA